MKLSALSARLGVFLTHKIQQIWDDSYDSFLLQEHFLSNIQGKASQAILNCKSGKLDYNTSQCPGCGHLELHNNSCRNRSCPNCQTVDEEIWVDKRGAEVTNTPYFRVVFTLPRELNLLTYCNQELLYGFPYRYCTETLLELSSDKKYLGITPGTIQALHTWNREIDYHTHIYCTVSGGRLAANHKIRKSSSSFFIPVQILRDKFKGKYPFSLGALYRSQKPTFPSSCQELCNPYYWSEFRDSLYRKDWCPYTKEAFNGFDNATEYLGRYTHKITIFNSWISSVDERQAVSSVKRKRPGDSGRTIALDNTEFIRRYLVHVLPPGLRKICHYGFLDNRGKGET